VQVHDLRAGVLAWIDARGAQLVAPLSDGSVDAQLDHQRRVQRMLFDDGWMRWGWPKRVGGFGGSPILRAVLGEELTGRALVHTTSWSMHEVLGPAVAEFGRPEVVEEIFPRLLRGDEFWCQGFSEPDAGSDLGSLRTTARPHRDGWLLTGEKLWTSFAQHATRAVVLARTGGPGSGGISAFLVDMASAGVGVRPLATMAGVEEFCSTTCRCRHTACSASWAAAGGSPRTSCRVNAGRSSGSAAHGWPTTSACCSTRRMTRRRRRRSARPTNCCGRFGRGRGPPRPASRPETCPLRRPPWTRS
jgi:alkylation response protein AidB-like acyl-CoA dehydrogenase